MGNGEEGTEEPREGRVTLNKIGKSRPGREGSRERREGKEAREPGRGGRRAAAQEKREGDSGGCQRLELWGQSDAGLRWVTDADLPLRSAPHMQCVVGAAAPHRLGEAAARQQGPG